MPLEDPKKVDAFVKTLSGKFPGKWIAVNEAFSFPTATGTWENVSFNPGRGYLVKLFVNLENGEIKSFPLSMFKP